MERGLRTGDNSLIAYVGKGFVRADCDIVFELSERGRVEFDQEYNAHAGRDEPVLLGRIIVLRRRQLHRIFHLANGELRPAKRGLGESGGEKKWLALSAAVSQDSRQILAAPCFGRVEPGCETGEL